MIPKRELCAGDHVYLYINGKWTANGWQYSKMEGNKYLCYRKTKTQTIWGEFSTVRISSAPMTIDQITHG